MVSLHSPDVRTIVHEERGWQILVHPRNGAGFCRRVAEGRLHLQMWHPHRKVSVLLPSLETNNRYEIFSRPEHPIRVCSYDAVCRELEDHYDLVGLSSERLSEFRIWFVLSAQIGVTHDNFWAQIPCCRDES